MATYDWNTLASDLCYFGVTFYIWAFTVKMDELPVCPTNRPLSGAAEKVYIVVFLMLNAFGSILLYPFAKEAVSPWKMGFWIVLAIIFSIGTPLYLRARIQW